MAALPSNVGFGTVKGVFIRAVGDTADAGREPDAVPLPGLEVVFKADIDPKLVRNTSASPPVMIVLDDIVCTTDASGVLLGPDGAATVQLVASTDPDLSPTNWTWHVYISGPNFPTINFSFPLGEGQTLDLTTVAPTAPDGGSDLAGWQSAVAATLANKIATQAIADSLQRGVANGIAALNSSGQVVDASNVRILNETEVNSLVTGKANVASPTFTGTPAAPTAAAGTSTTQLATTAFVAALGALKANLASPTFTGTPAAPTAAAGVSTTQIATTAFVAAAVTAGNVGMAPLASPTFTGTPAAPTAAAGVSTTQIATTAFVAAAVTAGNVGMAPLASPTFTGTPIAPTATAGTNTTQIATTAFVTAAVAAGGGGGGGGATIADGVTATTSVWSSQKVSDQLALKYDSSAATTALALKANLASPTFTGTPLSTTAAAGTNTTQIATTAFVAALGALKANLASPTFTGTPLAPTATAGTNTTQIATTAFVAAAVTAGNVSMAPLASPTFTGTPAAPTATAGTNTTQIATTAFVAAALATVTVADASLTAKGIVELATTAETTTGTDAVRAVTPAGVAAAIANRPTSSNGSVLDIIMLTQAAYDALTPKSATTLYIIT